MKLTKYLKDEIAQRIINSLPKGVDYETLMQKLCGMIVISNYQ